MKTELLVYDKKREFAYHSLDLSDMSDSQLEAIKKVLDFFDEKEVYYGHQTGKLINKEN